MRADDIAMTAALPAIPVVDVRDGGPTRHALQNPAKARALRDACLGIFPRAVRPLVPSLDRISQRWLVRSRSPYVQRDRAHRRRARLFRRLALERLDAMGMHVAGLRARRRAVARAHARLAVRGSRTAHRACAHERGGRRFRQRDLARLCRRAHGDGAATLCRLYQSGADVAADAPSVAAAMRLRRQCRDCLGRRRPHAAGSIAASSFRGLRRLSRGPADAGDDAAVAVGDLHAGRLRSATNVASSSGPKPILSPVTTRPAPPTIGCRAGRVGKGGSAPADSW